jgi:DNA polymerase I
VKTVAVVDAAVSSGEARVWLREIGGGVRVHKVAFSDYFLVERGAFGFLAPLSGQGFEAEEVEKRILGGGTASFLKVSHESKGLLSSAAKTVERAGFATYDSDLWAPHKLLAKLKLVPLKAYRYTGRSFEEVEESLEPLPLSVAELDIEVPEGVRGKVALRCGEEIVSSEGAEREVAEDLGRALASLDPDIVAVNIALGDFYSLAKRWRRLFGVKLGRGEGLLEGRGFVEKSLMENIGLAGLEERCRATGLPPTAAGRRSYGRLVDARQVYLMLSMGYAVPKARHRNVHVRTLLDLHRGDRGGLIYQPAVGVFENVAELDFESMFPHVIAKFNVSYETVSLKGVAPEPKGLLVHVVEPLLERRLKFKRLKEALSGSGRVYAEQRQSELKMILVSSYGYSGNNYNRLGNPLTFEWINRLSRRVMLEVYKLVEEKGYAIVYGDTDSVFVRKKGASRLDYERLAGEIADEIGIPMKLNRVFKFIAFPEAKSLNGSPVKRYFGVTVEGELVLKGVEAVRSDYPLFVRRFQVKLVEEVFKHLETSGASGALAAARELLNREAARLYGGGVPLEELAIEKTIRKSSYKVEAAHVLAAKQMGACLKGSRVRFVLAKHSKSKPHLRVRPFGSVNVTPDCEAYGKLLAHAYQTVVSPLNSILL